MPRLARNLLMTLVLAAGLLVTTAASVPNATCQSIWTNYSGSLGTAYFTVLDNSDGSGYWHTPRRRIPSNDGCTNITIRYNDLIRSSDGAVLSSIDPARACVATVGVLYRSDGRVIVGTTHNICVGQYATLFADVRDNTVYETRVRVRYRPWATQAQLARWTSFV